MIAVRTYKKGRFVLLQRYWHLALSHRCLNPRDLSQTLLDPLDKRKPLNSLFIPKSDLDARWSAFDRPTADPRKKHSAGSSRIAMYHGSGRLEGHAVLNI